MEYKTEKAGKVGRGHNAPPFFFSMSNSAGQFFQLVTENLKNGNFGGLLVVWRGGKRSPDKAKRHSVPKNASAYGYSKIWPHVVPPEVIERFEEAGLPLDTMTFEVP